MIYLQLFWEFFQTGLFAAGGGMATIPFLYNMSDKTGWFTQQDLANMIAVGESTPGPIGVNMATYVGYVTGMEEGTLFSALLGAVTATLGLVLPSLIVILIVAAMLKRFKDSPLVQKAFYGLRPASTGLIAAAGFTVLKIALLKEGATFWATLDWVAIALFAVMVVLTQLKPLKKIHPIAFIAAGALIGILLGM